MTSVVYFVQAESGLIKIGVTDNLVKRLSHLSGQSEAVKLICAVRGTRDLERHLHEVLAADRVRGEWFRPSEAVLAAVQSLETSGSKSVPADRATAVEPVDRDSAPARSAQEQKDETEARRLLQRAADALDDAQALSRHLVDRAFRLAPWIEPGASR